MRAFSLFIIVVFAVPGAFAQKPRWVDAPGIYTNEFFVGIGVVREKKEDKGRQKAEKKAKAAIKKLLKKKYGKKDIKSAMKSFRIEEYYTDSGNDYVYALGLLPIESIDKDYARQKMLDKARSAAMNAAAAMNAQFEENPDVSVMNVDEEPEEDDGDDY